MELNKDIAVWQGMMTEKECQNLIDHYERMAELNLSYSRQQIGDAPRHRKSDRAVFVLEQDTLRFSSDTSFLAFFIDRFWNCYNEYVDHYSVLAEASKHQIRMMKLQKTRPGDGYHVWHFENDSLERAGRICAWGLYLNTIEQGGETEFLYQGVRIPAVQGTLVIWPAGFTHAHRGNPPLSGDKYLLTGWVEY
jgi:hypothetical protein